MNLCAKICVVHCTHAAIASHCRQTSGNHKIRKNDMKIFAEATLGNTVDTSKREGFMKYDREVLAFDALWDDRAALYGDLHKFRLHYYLQVCV
jgi:DUF1126 PH-like domain